MNPNIPLEAYLPPANMIEDINFIVANDQNGLNVGTYFARVNPWSAWLMAETLGMPGLKPDVFLKYSDQSAVEYLLKEVSPSDVSMSGAPLKSRPEQFS